MSETIEKPIPQQPEEAERDRSLRIIGVQASIALLAVAFILDMVKRGDAHGSWQASHFSWRIRTVLWAGGLYAVTAPLWLLLVAPGWIAWGVISIWFAYRIVRGWLALNDRRPAPA